MKRLLIIVGLLCVATSIFAQRNVKELFSFEATTPSGDKVPVSAIVTEDSYVVMTVNTQYITFGERQQYEFNSLYEKVATNVVEESISANITWGVRVFVLIPYSPSDGRILFYVGYVKDKKDSYTIKMSFTQTLMNEIIVNLTPEQMAIMSKGFKESEEWYKDFISKKNKLLKMVLM